jgi:hypothetical protein
MENRVMACSKCFFLAVCCDASHRIDNNSDHMHNVGSRLASYMDVTPRTMLVYVDHGSSFDLADIKK